MQYIDGGVYFYDNNKTLILFEGGHFSMFGWETALNVSDVESDTSVDRRKIGELVLTLPVSSINAKVSGGGAFTPSA